MGNPYTRNDTPNNIDDGNIIDASDFDGEFDKLEDAFDGSAGHTHDGTTGEGGPITTLGPTQEVLITATTVEPATTNTVDLGTAAKEWKDLHLKGDLNMDGGLTGGGTASFVGEVSVSGDGTHGFRAESNNSADSYLDLWRLGANSYRIVNDGGILKFYHGSTPAGVLTNTWFQIANTGVATFYDSVNIAGLLVCNSNIAAGGILSSTGNTSVGAVLAVVGESHLNGDVGIANVSPTAPLDVNGDTIRVRTGKTPASASATGNEGDICWDANYIYVCTSTNTWKRAALSTW